MDDTKINDKAKILEILNEIANLKAYSSELYNNTRGEKLDNYNNNLAKNIAMLNDKVENIYTNLEKNN